MMAWVDFLYSDEGSMIANYGIEGDTYDLVDGKIKMRDENNPSETYGENVNKALLQMGGGTFCPCKKYVDDYDLYVDLENDPTANLLEDTYDYFEENDLLYPAWPTLTLTDEEIEENSDVNADVDSYRLTYRAEVITGKKDLDSTWDEYIDTLYDMGLQTAIDNMNEAYSRLK